jgi:hypothetical protein
MLSTAKRSWDAMIAMGFDEPPLDGEETAEVLAERLEQVLAESGLFV